MENAIIQVVPEILMTISGSDNVSYLTQKFIEGWLTQKAQTTQRIYLRIVRSYLKVNSNLSREGILEFFDDFQNQIDPPKRSTLDVYLSALKGLAAEATAQGYLNELENVRIQNLKTFSKRGRRLGTWLTQEEIQTLLDSIDTSTLQGVRNKALLGVGFGAGLRRSELCSLTWNHIQKRLDRTLIVDLEGKGGVTRTVPIADWVVTLLENWRKVSPKKSFIFLTIRKGGLIINKPLIPERLYQITSWYDLNPHDLRRSFAMISYSAGAPLDQISQSLGHSSLAITLKYLNICQDLRKGPGDYWSIEV